MKSVFAVFFRRIGPITVALVCACLIFGFHPAWGDDPRTGRALSRINLRTLPALDGEIITGVDAGEAVRILKEQDGWYQLAVQRGNYGFMGWAYGKYIQPDNVDVSDAADGSPEAAAPPPPPETGQAGHGPPDTTRDESTTLFLKNDDAAEKTPLSTDQKETKAFQSQGGAEKPAAEPSQSAPVILSPPAKIPRPAADVARDGPAAVKMKKQPLKSESAKGVSEKSHAPAPKDLWSASSRTNLFSFFIRLTSLILSGLALWFAYRAFKTAQAAMKILRP